MSETTRMLCAGDARCAPPGSPMTVGTRRIAMGVVAIRRVPPICEPPRGGRWIAAAAQRDRRSTRGVPS